MPLHVNEHGRVVTSLGEMLRLGGQWDNYWGDWWECRRCNIKWTNAIRSCVLCEHTSARRNYHREHFRKTVETRLPWLTASQIQKALEQGKRIHIHRSFEWPPAPVDWDDL